MSSSDKSDEQMTTDTSKDARAMAKPPTPVRVDARISRKYDALLDNLRKAESSDPAANRFPWQCEIALKQLSDLAIAKQHQVKTGGVAKDVVVRIRTDSFPLRIYDGEVADRLQEFLDCGGELRILLTVGESVYDVSSLRRFIGIHGVETRKENAPPQEDFRNHSFVVDEQAYRFEAPHQPFDGEEFRDEDDFHPEIPARICFNHRDGAKSLNRLFDALWEKATVVTEIHEGDPNR